MIAVTAVGVDHVAANLRQAGLDADAAARKVASDGSIMVNRALQRRLTVKGPWDPFWGQQGPAGAALGRRSGDTVRSISPGGISATFRSPGGAWSAAVGSDKQALVTHEYGGTISGHPMLKIPTAAALRYQSGTSAFSGKTSDARNIPGAFIWRGKHAEGATDRAWIAVREGDKLVLLYMLKRSVTLRPRGIFAATRAETEPLIAQLGRAEVAVVTTRANT